MSKKTIKDLNKDFLILKEMVEALNSKHEEREKALEARIEVLENDKKSNNLQNTESVEKFHFKCKECTMTFDKKCDLKMHILALHPRNYPCNLCDQTFETHINFESHLKDHEAAKPFKCDYCGKTFYMKWRLGKHLQQHESCDAKFCHYFNNDKFCRFEEHGCMFLHEDAPACKNINSCRIRLCQYKHINASSNEAFKDNSDVVNIARYSCMQCMYTFETEALLNNHMEVNHGSKIIPIPVIFKGFDMFGRRISNENDEQVDKSEETDNDVYDDEGLQGKQDDARSSQVWRCDYGLCDLQQILFKTKEDLKTHLENQHGIF
jgi:hypothetical protein